MILGAARFPHNGFSDLDNPQCRAGGGGHTYITEYQLKKLKCYAQRTHIVFKIYDGGRGTQSSPMLRAELLDFTNCQMGHQIWT